MTTFNLDFSLTTDSNRLTLISDICASTEFTSRQYTQMADYILLANNNQQTFIYPEIFKSPKRSHNEQSLEELLDNTNENDYIVLESTLSPVQRTIYKKSPRKIDRNNPILQQNPYMQSLWQIMDEIDSKLAENPNDYKLSKMSIDLHKQQYDLLESILPQWPIPIPSQKPHASFFKWSRGIQLENGDYADLDLSNYTHMAKFLHLLPDLYWYCSYSTSPHYMESELYQLLQDTLQAIRNAALPPLYLDVLSLYWYNIHGKTILQYLEQKYDKKYNQPTLSTMFNYTIAKKIAVEYAEIRDERLYRNTPSKWRKCRKCGTTKFLSTYNFHRASGKQGGFAYVCKDCVMEERHQHKGTKNIE